MSPLLINHSPDLKKLRDSGYEVEVKHNHLVVNNVPYVDSQRNIKLGILISELTLAGDRTARPSTHVALFMGDHPCRKDGGEIVQIKHSNPNQVLGPGLVANHSFSNKPKEGYADYFEKMTRYIEIISSHAASIDPAATPRTFKPIPTEGSESVFNYLDTASSRAGISLITDKLQLPQVAIVGIGGTGSFVLDLVAKTPVGQIHLFDGDNFLQHNAFRSPGAAPLDVLRKLPKKVDYFANLYSNIHKHIVPHSYDICESNVMELAGMGFVFICVDRGSTRSLIIDQLVSSQISFVDVGMGLERVDNSLLGILRVTTSTPKKRAHLRTRVAHADSGGNDEYSQNIQIADLNALNAALAVIKWKKLYGFYQDLEGENHSTYTINVNLLTSDEESDDS